jgi:DNA-binding beta-propeller fold protein YncE
MKKNQLHRVRPEGESILRFFTLTVIMVLSGASLGLAQGTTSSNLSTNAGPPGNQLVATISLGFNVFPEAVVVSPDSQTIYVAGWGPSGGLVFIINSQSNTVTDTIAVGDLLNSIVITPDGSTLYVGSRGTASLPPAVYAISTATKTVTATLNFFPEFLAMNPNGTQVYVTGGPVGDTHIASIDVATNSLNPKAIKVGKIPHDITVSPNGKTIYVAMRDSVNRINLATKQVTANIPLTTLGAVFFTFNPDGRTLYMSRGRFLYVADTITNSVARKDVLQPKAVDGQSAITPDGLFLYQPYANLNTVVMLDTSTYKPSGNPISVNYPEAIVVAPATSFAYVIGFEPSGDSAEGEVYVINISPL